MKKNLRVSSIISLFMVMAMLSCTTQPPVEQQKTNPLEGVWELVSGEFYRGDSIISYPGDMWPDLKSYKFISKTRWAVLSQDTSNNFFHTVTGKYRTTENTYVEYFEIHENIESIGDSAVFTYNLEGNKWTISTDWMKEERKRIE